MSRRILMSAVLGVSALALATVYAAGLSEQQADAFARKMALVTQQGAPSVNPARSRRTPFTEAEVNSWMAYRGQELLPSGVSNPTVTLVGDGKVSAAATVDLETIAAQRSTGRLLDPWSYLKGRLPVTVSGILRTQNGVGRFELQEAAVSGIPVPASVLQDMVSYYSRSPEAPSGVRLDEPFPLPARIRQIELGQGQAVVVQ